MPGGPVSLLPMPWLPPGTPWPSQRVQARILLERVLAVSRPGPEYPDTAHSLNNLAKVLHAPQGNPDTARTLYERALSIYEARLGTDHPDAVRSRERLAAAVADLENRRQPFNGLRHVWLL